jgi:predicted transglutaminase-like cysteine proteinase
MIASLLGVPAQAGLLGSTEHARSGMDSTGRWSAMLARSAQVVADPCAAPALVSPLADAFPHIAPAAAIGVSAAPTCQAAYAAKDMHDAVRNAAALPPVERVRLVNALVNRRPYVIDKANYGAEDYWATLAEFAARGGDCEDYAIAKYMLLKAAGVAPESMRVAVVFDLALGISHAVLSVDVDGTRYILDNQVEEALPDSDVNYYQPVYSVNEHGWWVHMPAS